MAYAAWIGAGLSALAVVRLVFAMGSLQPLRLVLSVVVSWAGLLFIYSLIAHAILKVLRSASHGFVATFRIVCYSTGALLFNLVPLFGGILALGWGVVMLCIGIVALHRTRWPAAITAVVAPSFVLFGLVWVRAYLPGLGCLLF